MGDGSEGFVLHIPLQAEKPGEVDRTVKLKFHESDDWRGVAERFCQEHDISAVGEAVEAIEEQMHELIYGAIDAGTVGATSRDSNSHDGTHADTGAPVQAAELLRRQAEAVQGSAQQVRQDTAAAIAAARERLRAKREASKGRVGDVSLRAEGVLAQAKAEEKRHHEMLDKLHGEELEAYREIRRKALGKA